MNKQVMDGMTDRDRVINVSSVNGSKGAFGQTNYSAAKAGMHGFTKASPWKLRRKGVTVNTISPGLRRCRSPNTTTWSRHSRRIEPIVLSQYPFCHGDRGAVGRSRMLIARRRRMRTSP
jgi:NAD(P)-dependent dehydrogenase (short-subunit alcohol dehydrogenase family)